MYGGKATKPDGTVAANLISAAFGWKRVTLAKYISF
jgi:hypothetical protein